MPPRRWEVKRADESEAEVREEAERKRQECGAKKWRQEMGYKNKDKRVSQKSKLVASRVWKLEWRKIEEWKKYVATRVFSFTFTLIVCSLIIRLKWLIRVITFIFRSRLGIYNNPKKKKKLKMSFKSRSQYSTSCRLAYGMADLNMFNLRVKRTRLINSWLNR